MLHNILVPLDGSSVSETALPYAVALAGRTGARLTLMRAAHAAPLTIDSAKAQAQVLAEAEAYLAERAADLRAKDYVVETGVPYGAAAADWIVEEATLRQADAIVMGTHDRIGPDRWIHGSVAEAVVSRAPVPVVLVHAADGARPVEHFDWRQPTLLVTLDGSTLAEEALPPAVNLARQLKGRIVLLTVVTDLSVDQRPAAAAEILEAATDRVKHAGVPVESVVRAGQPAAEIAHVAREQNAALVVIATHGRTGLARTVLGSIAGEVVHRSPSPVMLIRPPELRLAEDPAVVGMPAPASF